MSRIERRPFSEYGITLSGAFGKRFWQGVVWGLAFETVEVLAIFAFGGFTFGTFALVRAEMMKFAILWAVAFVLVGLFEEFVFRSYAQFTLSSGMGFWPHSSSRVHLERCTSPTTERVGSEHSSYFCLGFSLVSRCAGPETSGS
jgi:hypothetical protein